MSLLFFIFILSFKTDLKQKIMFLMFLSLNRVNINKGNI